MAQPQNDRPSLAFSLGIFAVGAFIAYAVFKQILIMGAVNALNSGDNAGPLFGVPDIIFAGVVVFIGAAYVSAYRRETARLARRAEVDDWISAERRGTE